MNFIDIVILILLAFGALLGFKRGFTNQLVSLIGIFVIIILSFVFKNPISVFLYNHFPFLKFGGVFKDITVLNIILYEVIAFIIVFIILFIIFRILLKITKVFEKILSATIILGIPSKLLGMVLGIIEGIIYVFIVLYILSLPVFNVNIAYDSKVANTILNKTPILHKVCDKSLSTFNDIIELKNKYKEKENKEEFNNEALKILIKNKVITKNNALSLIKKGKLKNVNVE